MKSKQPINMKNKVLIITTLLLIGIAFWVLTYLTPEYRNDYGYKFIFTDEGANIKTPITSVKDILISQYNHYFSYNGRIIVHSLVQLFTSILGKPIFNIANAIIFLVFVYIITRMYTKITALNMLFSSFVILLLYPIFKETALWMTGSINYMWTCVFTCIFLWIIEKHKEEKLSPIHFVWSIPCIFIGWTHEGITLPLSISLFIYAIINYKNIYKRAIFPLIIGFIIGSLLCSFAPGTMNRASNTTNIEIYSIISRFMPSVPGVQWFVKLKALIILLCTVIALLYIKRISFLWIKNYYTANLILCNALLFSFGFVLTGGFIYSLRASTGIELFAIILLLDIVQRTIRFSRKFKLAVCTIGCIIYGVIIYYSIANYQEYKHRLSQIQPCKNNIVGINKINSPYYIESYILEPILDAYLLAHDEVRRKYIATALHCDNIIFVPNVVCNNIINHSNKGVDISKQKDCPFYVVPVQNSIDSIKPTFILSPTDFQKLPFYIRPLAHKLLRYTATEISCDYYVVEIEDRNYLFIAKNIMIDDRVKDISLKK